jgi:hypothetical protein
LAKGGLGVVHGRKRGQKDSAAAFSLRVVSLDENIFSRAAALLKENGQIFIYDMHPFVEMLPQDDCKEPDVLRIVYPYFKGEPYTEYGSLDYVGGQTYDSPHARYSFVHKVSDILMALIENRITIEHFSEYEMDISAMHHRVENARAGIPLSYILIGRKA